MPSSTGPSATTWDWFGISSFGVISGALLITCFGIDPPRRDGQSTNKADDAKLVVQRISDFSISRMLAPVVCLSATQRSAVGSRNLAGRHPGHIPVIIPKLHQLGQLPMAI